MRSAMFVAAHRSELIQFALNMENISDIATFRRNEMTTEFDSMTQGEKLISTLLTKELSASLIMIVHYGGTLLKAILAAEAERPNVYKLLENIRALEVLLAINSSVQIETEGASSSRESMNKQGDFHVASCSQLEPHSAVRPSVPTAS